MDQLHTAIPVLSLLVAVLAVFVGPFVSLRVASRQISAPMSQTWVNSLRDMLAEFISTAYYYAYNSEKLTDEACNRLSFPEYQIRLMLNLKEEDQRKLDALIRRIASYLGEDFTTSNDFEIMQSTALELSRAVLRREWDRVKEPIKIG